MNRKEPPEDNVPFLLGSLVRPIGRSAPGTCQEDETAAIKRHSSAFSPGGKQECWWFGGPWNFPPWCSSLPTVWAHVYRVINNRTEAVVFEYPFLPLPLQTTRWVVLESLEATSRKGCL